MINRVKVGDFSDLKEGVGLKFEIDEHRFTQQPLLFLNMQIHVTTTARITSGQCCAPRVKWFQNGCHP